MIVLTPRFPASCGCGALPTLQSPIVGYIGYARARYNMYYVQMHSTPRLSIKVFPPPTARLPHSASSFARSKAGHRTS